LEEQKRREKIAENLRVAEAEQRRIKEQLKVATKKENDRLEMEAEKRRWVEAKQRLLDDQQRVLMQHQFMEASQESQEFLSSEELLFLLMLHGAKRP
jgi:hypothetical protein